MSVFGKSSHITRSVVSEQSTCEMSGKSLPDFPGSLLTTLAGDVNIGVIACMTDRKGLLSMYGTLGRDCPSAQMRLGERVIRPGRTLTEVWSCALPDLTSEVADADGFCLRRVRPLAWVCLCVICAWRWRWRVADGALWGGTVSFSAGTGHRHYDANDRFRLKGVHLCCRQSCSSMSEVVALTVTSRS